MAQWANFPIDKALFTNADQAILSKANAAMENCYMNEAEGQSRFPGRIPFAILSGTKTYLTKFRGNLIAATDDGKIYRINQYGEAQDVTGVPIAGGMRVVFSATEDELAMAAGGPIVRLAKDKTEILSKDAPNSTHVGFLDGFLVALEPGSGRLFRSDAGQYRTWNPLNVITAEAKPDNLIALAVTPFRELLLAGEDSVEQFERIQNAESPFARRWSSGEGLLAPYTFLATDDGTFGLNPLREFVRFNQQVTVPESNTIGLSLERIDNWDEAWTAQVHIKGQKFIILQAPNATNIYGTAGVTALFDYRARRWSNLYDWNDDLGVPDRWAPWSYQALWGRHFVGVPGGVAELTPEGFQTFDVKGNRQIQRQLVRSGHVSKWGSSEIDRIRLRLRRGVGDQTPSQEARIGIRANLDNKYFTKWQFASLGRPGERHMTIEMDGWGQAETWQFEYMVTDPVPVELVEMKVHVEELEW